MKDEFPEDFQHLKQDYASLAYPGDLPRDLGMVPARSAESRRWSIGPATTRWLGWTAAAAAVALVVGGVWHALSVSGVSPVAPSSVAVAPASQPAVASQTGTKTDIASNIKSVQPEKKAETADDSIPLWSDVNSPTLSTASAGLPSESLIVPTLSDTQDDNSSAGRAKAAQSRS